MTDLAVNSGKQTHLVRLLAGAVLLTTATIGPASAQENPKPPAVTGPLTTGTTWQTEVSPSTETTPALDARQTELVQKINAYLNGFSDLQGTFVQTNPDNEQLKGRFYVMRPGRMRFDYSAPSKLRIISNGDFLSIEDHDLNTVDRYPLDATPFRMLLKKEVDLIRDANILNLLEYENQITISLVDKSRDTVGLIKLHFTAPDIALKEWTITDAQGLKTKIEVAELSQDQNLKDGLFKVGTIALKNVFDQ